MKLLFLLLALFIVGCSTPAPSASIQSTNLTDMDIPQHVDEMILERLPETESITYMKTLRLPRSEDSISVCYIAIGEGNRHYGLATFVEGRWFVTEPKADPMRLECPSFISS